MFSRATLFLLLAFFLAAFQNSFTEGQATAVAPVTINRNGWVITATNYQDANTTPQMAIDNNDATFWHSVYAGSNFPITLQVDMQNQYLVYGFNYLPRQDGNTNGMIAQHNIDISTDGKTWTTVATGTWLNNANLKQTLWNAKPARYVRLVAQSEVNGNRYASAAEIDVLTNPASILNRQGWSVKADSQQGGGQSYNATEAIDGSVTTYWHTQFNPTIAPLPHYFTIDQGKAVTVGGLTYLPRPASSGANGHIGQYTVRASSDGKTWINVVSGSWYDDATLKQCQFPAITYRYFQLVALSEAGNRGGFTSASEINLYDGSTQVAPFKVTVDSQETAQQQDYGIYACDGDLTTIWHTAYSTGVTNFPHYISIDMGASYAVHSLSYTPRQDGGVNGNIGSHHIDVSNDGNTWTTVAQGMWIDDQTTKLVNFNEQMARFVRLVATSEAGNRGPWSSAAEVAIGFDTNYIPPPATKGMWGLTIDFPTVPVAAAMTYTGELITWSAFMPTYFTGGTGQTVTASYQTNTQVVSQFTVTKTQHDMFCPGISMDFWNRVLVTGGNDAAQVSWYQPWDKTWSAASVMWQGRGYQASTTLSDGRVFTIGGSWSGGQGNKNGEVYDFGTNVWTQLAGCKVAPMLTNDAQGIYRADNHAWLFGWKQGSVFQAGPSKAMNWYYPTNGGSYKGVGNRGNDNDSMCGVAVMFDAVNGKILTVGGATSYQGATASWNTNLITIGTPGTVPTVQQLTSATYRRIYHNGVVLPNGNVVIIGGQEWGDPFTDDEAILYPELWSPVTQKWTIMAPFVIARTYHSIALLMPDATVITGGGGLCEDCSMNHMDAQIWWPPYLFNSDGSQAARPTITGVSGYYVGVGKSMTINTTGSVSSFALIRLGSATHTMNTDQRRIAVTPTGGNGKYTITIPSDPGIALPGAWYVFALTAAGTPSVGEAIWITL